MCINTVTTKTLQELGAAKERVVKITPAVDQRFLRDVSPALVESTIQHFGLRQPYIIAVGRLIERKGFDTLIEAFSQLDQTKYATVKLVFVGDGPDRPRLSQVVAENYMQTSITFLGSVEDRYLPALYTGAEFFALTPRDIRGDAEGFGIVYLEAAARGKPAVATNTGGVAEAVVHNATGLIVEADSPSAVKDALTSLLGDAVLRHRLGEQARARVQKEFLWEQRRQSLSDLLKPLL